MVIQMKEELINEFNINLENIFKDVDIENDKD